IPASVNLSVLLQEEHHAYETGIILTLPRGQTPFSDVTPPAAFPASRDRIRDVHSAVPSGSGPHDGTSKNSPFRSMRHRPGRVGRTSEQTSRMSSVAVSWSV